MFSFTVFYERSSWVKQLNVLSATDMERLEQNEENYFFNLEPLKEFMILSMTVSHFLPTHKTDTSFSFLKFWLTTTDLSV